MKKNEKTEREAALVPSDIRPLIHEVRGVQVILDRDLAFLYGVLTKNLNKAVKRNLERFPEDFMFQLTKDEVLRFQIGTLNDGENPLLIGAMTDSRSLRFQNGTTKERRGGSRYVPYAFTENGIAMLSSVLRSERAIEVNIRIMREFVSMRKTLASLAPMLARIEVNERRQIADQAKNDANQEKNEERFRLILDAMQDKTFPPQKVFYDGQVYDAKADEIYPLQEWWNVAYPGSRSHELDAIFNRLFVHKYGSRVAA